MGLLVLIVIAGVVWFLMAKMDVKFGTILKGGLAVFGALVAWMMHDEQKQHQQITASIKRFSAMSSYELKQYANDMNHPFQERDTARHMLETRRKNGTL